MSRAIKCFDEDYNELADKVGEEVIKSNIKCKYCENIGRFLTLSKYKDARLYGRYGSESEQEETHWVAEYFYVIKCPQCDGIHLCSFRTDSEKENEYEEYIHSCISSEEPSSSYREVNIKEIRNFKILYPQYTDKDLLRDAIIEKISQEFIKIYNQAQIAEQLKLDKISGMAYRKALEFLIKDFAIYKNPDDEHKIKGCKYRLSHCITDYYDKMPDVQNCAKRATWLGNDETHYTRKWKEKDITNLKELIKAILYGIKMDELVERYTTEMP